MTKLLGQNKEENNGVQPANQTQTLKTTRTYRTQTMLVNLNTKSNPNKQNTQLRPTTRLQTHDSKQQNSVLQNLMNSAKNDSGTHTSKQTGNSNSVH